LRNNRYPTLCSKTAFNPIASLAFGCIQQSIRLLNQFLMGVIGGGHTAGHTEADGDLPGMRGTHVGQGGGLDRLAYLLSQLPGVRPVGFRQDDGEFLTAIAGGQIRGALAGISLVLLETGRWPRISCSPWQKGLRI
jgi:hypothetical protein